MVYTPSLLLKIWRQTLKSSDYSKIVRASAIYDLLVTAPFATPFTFKIILSTMAIIHNSLGLSGQLPIFKIELSFFANLLGSIVIIWSILRIRTPEPRFGIYDGFGRLAFSLWMLWAITNGVSQVLIGFLILEFGWAIIQFFPIIQNPKILK